MTAVSWSGVTVAQFSTVTDNKPRFPTVRFRSSKPACSWAVEEETQRCMYIGRAAEFGHV